MSAKAKPAFRALNEKPKARGKSGPRTYTAEQLVKLNSQAIGINSKRAKKFASVAAFREWYGKGDNSTRYKDLKAEVQEDGSVIVWKELNNIQGYQNDGDLLVARNGLKVQSSSARKEAQKQGVSMKKYWEGQGGRKLSAMNLIAKIVGAQAKRAGIKLEGTPTQKVSAYQKVTKRIYEAVKGPALNALWQLQKTYPETNENGVSNEPKLTRTAEFKLMCLDPLIKSPDVTGNIIAFFRGGGNVARLDGGQASAIYADPRTQGASVAREVHRLFGIPTDVVIGGLGLPTSSARVAQDASELVEMPVDSLALDDSDDGQFHEIEDI